MAGQEKPRRTVSQVPSPRTCSPALGLFPSGFSKKTCTDGASPGDTLGGPVVPQALSLNLCQVRLMAVSLALELQARWTLKSPLPGRVGKTVSLPIEIEHRSSFLGWGEGPTAETVARGRTRARQGRGPTGQEPARGRGELKPQKLDQLGQVRPPAQVNS